MRITQRQLESILINEGIIQAAAVENPEGYDGGKTKLAMTIATQAINEINATNEDTQILDWLERNLEHLSHARATNSVYMDGFDVRGQLHNEARGEHAGPSHFRVLHRTIREAVIDAMNWKPKPL